MNNSKFIFVDCFGTMLFRTIPPEETKYVLAKKLSKIYKIDVSLLYRSILSAENMAKIRNEFKYNVRECTINEMAENCFDSLLNASLITLEVKSMFVNRFVYEYFVVEKEVTFVNENLKKKLIEEKKSGRIIVLVSNFFCGKEFFVSLFKEKQINDLFEYYFVSSDYMAGKGDGSLYKIAMKELGDISPKDICMIGNSNNTDVEPAKKLGISAYKIADEDALFDNVGIIGGNVCNSSIPKELNKLFFSSNYKYRFSNYAFPLFVFIDKLYKNLKEDKAKHVFFLSREGEFLKKLFDLYVLDKDYKPDTHYLLVSRNSLYATALKSLDEENFKYIFFSRKEPKIFDFLITLGFSIDEVKLILSECNIKNEDMIFSEDRLESIKGILKKSQYFVVNYEKNRNEQKKALKKYLEKFNVDFQSQKLFLVDVGWKGAMQDFIYFYFEEKIEIQGYYVGYRGQNGINSLNNCKRGLLWSNRPFSPTITEKIFSFRIMNYENILRATHNSVLKYSLNDNDPIILNDAVDDNRVYNTLVKPVQDEIYGKFSELMKIAKCLNLNIDVFAALYAKMFAFIKKRDWIWLTEISNTHYDFFAKLGTFSEPKISWKGYIRYRLGGVRLYWYIKTQQNKKLNRYN